MVGKAIEQRTGQPLRAEHGRPVFNKTLQDMRADGLIEFKNKVLTVLDPPKIEEGREVRERLPASQQERGRRR